MRQGTELSRLLSGELLMIDDSRVLVRRGLPRDVVRPVLGDVPGHVTPGDVVTITGEGFQRVSALGSAGQVLPTQFPSVFFMPAAGGGPIFGEVQGGWSNESLTWEVPQAAYPGAGWLHVVVAGVPSEGRPIVLQGAGRGSLCLNDPECSSGHCVGTTRKVCCNTSCGGGCESCQASEQAAGGIDGACGPRAAGTAPSAGCDIDPTNPCASRTGMCDGKGVCDFPPPETECALVAGGPSDGFCVTGTCTRPLPSVCSEDGLSVVEPDRSLRSCYPYRCMTAATPQTCGVDCKTSADCAKETRCAEDGSCRVPAPFVEAVDAGGCAITTATSGRSPSGAGLLLASLIAARVALRRERKRCPRADGDVGADSSLRMGVSSGQ
jgi:hypothetical protein